MPDEPLVLLLADAFSLRGTSAYTLRLAEHLSKQGFRTKVVCPDARMIEPQRRAELGIAEYPYWQTPLWGCLVRRWLLNDLLDDPPALIHVQSRGVLRLGTLLAKRLGCPFILTMHDFLQARERLPFYRPLGRRIIAVSEPVRDELLADTKLSFELITVIASGVEENDQPSEPVLNPGRIPVIGAAGPLEAVKGLHFFLGAAQRVIAAEVPAEFVIAGSGPEETNLRRVARELQIADHVTFVPNVFDLKTSLSAMDVFCLPSLRQGLGTIMLEAMALGRPVIATCVDGVDSIVKHNETGLLVSPANSDELSQRILELLKDPFLARRLSDNARQLVHRDFSIDRMIQQTADVYRTVLTEHTATKTNSR